MQTNYDEKQLREAVKKSNSIRQTLICLNLNATGGNYYTIKKYIKLYNIDISHFSGQSWSRNLNLGPKVDINEYLNNKKSINSHVLKTRLINEGIFQHKCQNCNLSTWLNSRIPIELHHIDGNRENNNLSNLEILCPNCHSMTSNHAGKKLKKKQKTKKFKNNCIRCQKPCNKKYCSIKCSNQNKKHKKKIVWPDIITLKSMVDKDGFCSVARKLGVSDNAVRKHLNSP